MLTPLGFYERPTFVPVLTSQKKSEEDFHFYKNRRRVTIAFTVLIAAAHTLDIRSGSFPRNFTQ